MKLCNRCGAELEDDAKVCFSCNTRTDGTEQTIMRVNGNSGSQLGLWWANFLGYFWLWVKVSFYFFTETEGFGALRYLVGVVGIFAAISVMGRKAKARQLVIATYLVGILSDFYTVMLCLGNGKDFLAGVSFCSVILAGIMIHVNNKYFENRKEIFTNGTEQVVEPENMNSEPQIGMKWADFLGYFGLWLKAVVYLGGTGFFLYADGYSYGSGYCFSIVWVMSAVICMITATGIVNRKADAKIYVISEHILGIMSHVYFGYLLLKAGENMIILLLIAIVIEAILLAVNVIYFNNRKDVFIN